jgi:DNA-binding SARP family transcriptional activator
MRFGVLGPLAVRSADGAPVRVPEAKVRLLLAALLLRPGTAVPAARLIGDLWGDAAPGSPTNTLQTKVSQLRRVLGRDLVRYGPAGYTLVVDPLDVDAVEFTRLVDRARTTADPSVRADLLGRALGLWRGPAYADVRDEPFVWAAATHLDEQRLVA